MSSFHHASEPGSTKNGYQDPFESFPVVASIVVPIKQSLDSLNELGADIIICVADSSQHQVSIEGRPPNLTITRLAAQHLCLAFLCLSLRWPSNSFLGNMKIANAVFAELVQTTAVVVHMTGCRWNRCEWGHLSLI